MKKQKVYLAGPFFTEHERFRILEYSKILRTKYEVFVPMEHFVEGGKDMPNDVWGQKVFEIDRKGIKEADFVVAVDYGFTSDAGTAWEVGFAYGCGKTVYVISACEATNPVHSLMMVNGSTKFFDSFGDLWIYLNEGKEKETILEVK